MVAKSKSGFGFKSGFNNFCPGFGFGLDLNFFEMVDLELDLELSFFKVLDLDKRLELDLDWI